MFDHVMTNKNNNNTNTNNSLINAGTQGAVTAANAGV